MRITGKVNEVDTLSAKQITETEQLSAELYAVPGGTEASAYLLVDEDGNEIPAVLVDKKTIFTATANDIRVGTTAATESGVTVGTKEIPAYHTMEGFKLIPVGSAYTITLLRCEYTKLQVLICAFGTSLSDSVATEKVSINGKVYPVNSTEELAAVTVDTASKQINLGITNDGDTPCVMRYFTYKEEY